MTTKSSSKKTTNNYKYAIPEDINMGEVYMATSTTTGKSYIGQAQCYTKCQEKFKKWGSIKRWQTHISEAKSKKDHNQFLNSAIRDYGRDDFTVQVLIKCELPVLNDIEIAYIKSKNTLAPNGYNIMLGQGLHGVSEEAKIKRI